MYKKVNETHLKVLSLFTRGYNKYHYIREVAKLLNISSRTAQIILDDLENKGILTSKTRGKIKLYRINQGSISKEYFILCEIYKKIRFLENNPTINEIIDKIAIENTLIIFGSYAKNKQKKDSDLDIFIVDSCDKDNIKNISKTYNIDINIKQYPQRIFKKELRNDILLKEIVEDHIIINGVEEFVKEIWIKLNGA